MAERVTLSALLTGTALSSPAKRVTAHYLVSSVPLSGNKHLSSHILATGSALAGAKVVTAHYIQSVISIHNYFELIRLESNSELHDFSGEFGPDHGDFTYTLASGPIPEHNPYRPRIPEQLVRMGDDFYDFYEENQNIHRQQHNITQMGDTTFPYQLFIQTHTDKQFALGSVGRFYHEDFGVIQCRYVLFAEMAQVGFAECPVGLFRNEELLKWRVTNNLDLSHPDLVVGIAAPFAVPENDTYGWVIVDGPSLQEIRNNSDDATIGESFAWDATGSVSNSAVGKVIGRRVNKVREAKSLLPGQIWIRTESFSEQELRNLIDDQTAALLATITALQDALGSIPGADDLATLNHTIASLQTALNLEINKRKAGDLAIQQQLSSLNFITATQLNNAVVNAANALTAATMSLQAQIDEIRAIALEALAKANLIPDLTPINEQITAILALIGQINTTPHGKFPVVDGAVPPNLVYLDDGSLVYEETF